MKARCKPMVSLIKSKKGFTLVELMVTMAIASVVLAGIYAAYSAQIKSHTTQQVVLDIQQNLRSAVYYLQRSVRMAGYGVTAGFVDDFADFVEPYKSAGASRTATSIAFTVDDDDDAQIDGIDGGNIDNIDNELIAFRLNGNTLEKYRASMNSWIPIADNIQTINFRYLKEDLSEYDPGGGDTLADIRSVEISLTAQPVEELTMAAAKRPQSLTIQVRCRNLRSS